MEVDVNMIMMPTVYYIEVWGGNYKKLPKELQEKYEKGFAKCNSCSFTYSIRLIRRNRCRILCPCIPSDILHQYGKGRYGH